MSSLQWSWSGGLFPITNVSTAGTWSPCPLATRRDEHDFEPFVTRSRAGALGRNDGAGAAGAASFDANGARGLQRFDGLGREAIVFGAGTGVVADDQQRKLGMRF